MPSASHSPSGVKDVNSKPRQSNSMIACCFGGSPCSYDLGAVLIEQEDSRLQFLHFHTKFASPLLPLNSLVSNLLTETGFPCVSRHEVHWTVKVYQKGFSAVSFGLRLVTPFNSAVSVSAYMLGFRLDIGRGKIGEIESHSFNIPEASIDLYAYSVLIYRSIPKYASINKP